MHVFGVIVWLGGVLYQAVLARSEESHQPGSPAHQGMRMFQPFVWMSVWTILVTGIALMVFNPRFVFLRFDDAWSVVLLAKQVVFVLMVIVAFGQARMLARVDELTAQANRRDDAFAYYRQMLRLGKANVVLAIVAVLLAAGLR
jgi:putative copper export protein